MLRGMLEVSDSLRCCLPIMIRVVLHFLLFLVLAAMSFFFGPAASAQSVSAGLQGIVTDPSGALVSAAKVSLENASSAKCS